MAEFVAALKSYSAFSWLHVRPVGRGRRKGLVPVIWQGKSVKAYGAVFLNVVFILLRKCLEKFNAAHTNK